MAHFAQLDEANLVIQVVVVNNETINNLPFPESEAIGVAFCQSLFGDATSWKQTSYNNNFRKNYAGVGFTYDSNVDAFIAPKRHPSWVFDTTTCRWKAPVPHPDDGHLYTWDESAQLWKRVSAK